MNEFEKLLKKFEEPKKDISKPDDKPEILVIDDDESIRRGLNSAFSHKYKVITAENSTMGQELLTRSIYCVILDVKMKELNGFSTYPKLKSKCPNVPIIFYTAFQSEHDLQEVINKHKPEGYVEKGKDISFLENLIENAVRKYSLILENESYKKNLEEKIEERTSELRKTNEELKRRTTQLVQSEKMASIGTLAAGIAHEINNPVVGFKRGIDQLIDSIKLYVLSLEEIRTITIDKSELELVKRLGQEVYQRGIDGFRFTTRKLRQKSKELEDLIKTLEISEFWKVSKYFVQMGLDFEHIERLCKIGDNKIFFMLFKYLKCQYDIGSIINMMNVSAKRIIKITESLKRYSHLDQNTEGETDIKQGIEDTLTILENELKYGIEIQKDYKDTKTISCYPAELTQVWTNIIYNAIQAMKGKGKLRIQTFEQKNNIGVRITDSGPGIPDKIRSRIFEPFFTTKDQNEGSGFGLGICYDIIKKHHGEINLYSQPGETTFEVIIPKN